MLIDVRDVSKRLGRRKVLEGVNLSIDSGEIVGLGGANGAGKTTLVNLLMGFLEADHGSIRVLGQSPLRRRRLGEIGWMPERPTFPPHLSATDVIAFQAATFPAWDSQHAKELASRLSLDSGVPVRSLSRGERARLALLCALGHRPRLLLLDDPTLGLDPGARRLLLGELLSASAEAGAGVLLATHQLAEADQALDRLAILADGRIVADHTPDEFKERYRRIETSEDSETPPVELRSTRCAGGWMTSDWNDESWRRYAVEEPRSRVKQLDLESIFVAITGAGK